MRVVDRVVLAVAGVVATGVGAAALLAPVAFREANGIGLGDDVALLSETRAAGGGLLAVGLLVLAGAVAARFGPMSALVGAAVYLGYGLARVVGLPADGWPGGGLVTAMAAELLLGTACYAVLYRFERGPGNRPGISAADARIRNGSDLMAS